LLNGCWMRESRSWRYRGCVRLSYPFARSCSPPLTTGRRRRDRRSLRRPRKPSRHLTTLPLRVPLHCRLGQLEKLDALAPCGDERADRGGSGSYFPLSFFSFLSLKLTELSPSGPHRTRSRRKRSRHQRQLAASLRLELRPSSCRPASHQLRLLDRLEEQRGILCFRLRLHEGAGERA
jgi:hypothetical protein